MNKKKKMVVIASITLLAVIMVLLFTKYILAEREKAKVFQYNVQEDGTIEITGYTGNETVVEIPAKIYGRKVAKLFDCFRNNQTIQEVNIPNTVKESSGTFMNASNLKKVTGGDGLECIGPYEFKMCTSLENIPKFPNIEYISMMAFYGCSSLTSIEIPEGVEYIANSAFRNAENLREVVIPESVIEIYDNAFVGTPWYESQTGDVIVGDGVLIKFDMDKEDVWIPQGVKFVSSFIIEDTVKNIYIPNTVKTMNYNIFNADYSVNVYIPSSVTTISAYAYEGAQLPSFIVEEGSTAEAYAKESGFPCEIVDDVQAIYESTLAEQ